MSLAKLHPVPENKVDFKCPFGVPWDSSDKPAPAPARVAKWGELHRFAAAYNGDEKAAKTWLAIFTLSVGDFGCPCKQHWQKFLKTFPPVFTSRRALFLWTWAAHNAVNERLGKPIFPLKDADRKYEYIDAA
jgi:hypothetical protein